MHFLIVFFFVIVTLSYLFIIVDLENTEDIQKIIKASQEVKQRAYCPYSKFKVGAALLCEDGTIITGKLLMRDSSDLPPH